MHSDLVDGPVREAILRRACSLLLSSQPKAPAEGPWEEQAAPFPALTSLPSMKTMPTARGPFWQSPGTPLLWSSPTSSWRKATISWRSVAQKHLPFGKSWDEAQPFCVVASPRFSFPGCISNCSWAFWAKHECSFFLWSFGYYRKCLHCDGLWEVSVLGFGAGEAFCAFHLVVSSSCVLSKKYWGSCYYMTQHSSGLNCGQFNGSQCVYIAVPMLGRLT